MIYVTAFSCWLFNTKQSFLTKFSEGICSEKLTQKAFSYLKDDGDITGFAVIQFYVREWGIGSKMLITAKGST